MTPAVDEVVAAEVNHRILEYDHVPGQPYGAEAAAALGVDADSVFKTLVARTGDGELVVGVVPVAGELDLKALARAAGTKRASMADPAEAERATGYVRGGISPLGQRRRLRTFVDESAFVFDEIMVSGGRRGLEIALSPADLVQMTDAVVGAIGR